MYEYDSIGIVSNIFKLSNIYILQFLTFYLTNIYNFLKWKTPLRVRNVKRLPTLIKFIIALRKTTSSEFA